MNDRVVIHLDSEGVADVRRKPAPLPKFGGAPTSSRR
jgi:hypothetical protein